MKQTKRVLHASMLTEPSTGIENQLLDEYEARKPDGLQWDVRIFITYESDIKHPMYVKSKKATSKLYNKYSLARIFHTRMVVFSYFNWLRSMQKNYDIILLRYLPSSIVQWLCLLLFQKKFFLVHHTNEPEELKLMKGGTSGLNLRIEKYFGPLCVRAAKGTVGATHEIAAFELARAGLNGKRKLFVYPNGINVLKNTDLLQLQDRRSHIPTFLFVASFFYPWQGLDLLLKELVYNQRDFLLHIVGGVPEELLDEYGKHSKFKFHGRKTKQEIGILSEESWIGISSLALERQGLTEACALKVREYLLMGLPVIGTYKEVLPDDFQFYKNLSIDAAAIFEFAENARKVSKDDVRNRSIANISKETTIAELYHSVIRE
jgi:glycosyltransferase involved in cell wall biosynthesis